jgi:hypothetical protein
LKIHVENGEAVQRCQKDDRESHVEGDTLVQTGVGGGCRGQAHGQSTRRWTDLSVGVRSPESIVRFPQQWMKGDYDEQIWDILSKA